MRRRERMNISLPAELRERMAEVDLNWSAIATAAFKAALRNGREPPDFKPRNEQLHVWAERCAAEFRRVVREELGR